VRDGTRVTDAAFEYLGGLGNLRRLGLCATQVTDEGVERLGRALPDCYIDY
jgi:hypothetical protein